MTDEEKFKRDFQIATWRNKEWQVRQKGNLRVLTLPEQPQDYYFKAGKIRDLIADATLAFSEFQTPRVEKPVFQVAIFPDDVFLESTGIPAQFRWAKACSRSLSSGDKEDVVCYSDGLVDEKWLKDGVIDVDVQREAIHELTPQFVDTHSLFPYNKSLALLEAHCEMMPRVIARLQQAMPESTEFLLGLAEKDFVTMDDLDQNGFAKYSGEPIKRNRAYGSAFLAGLYLANKFGGLKPTGEADYHAGIQRWYDIVWAARNPEELKTKVVNAIEIPYAKFYQSVEPILNGQQILRNFSS